MTQTPIQPVGLRPPAAPSETSPRRRHLTDRLVLLGRYFASTPGKMTMFAALAIAVILVAGLVSANTITNRQENHETLLAETEPVANASQTLYSSLTIADSAANTAFITGGIEPSGLRDRYQFAISQASSAIIAASQGIEATDEESVGQLAQINAHIATYSGLVETARANNRTGNPVGSAYLAEASALMQDSILPAAADLYDRQSTSVGDTERLWSAPPWNAFFLLTLAILALGGVQWWLRARTGRVLNTGLAAATFFVIVALLWTMVSGLLTANHNARGLSEGAAPMNELTRQRIQVQQLRAQETLSLVRRTDPETTAAERAEALDEVRSSLTSYISTPDGGSSSDIGLDEDGTVSSAVNWLDRWIASQNRADSLYQQGDYQGAIAISSGQDPGESGHAFDQLDESIQEAIELARVNLRTRIDEANAMSASSPAVLITLTALASMSTIGGIAPRIREYL